MLRLAFLASALVASAFAARDDSTAYQLVSFSSRTCADGGNFTNAGIAGSDLDIVPDYGNVECLDSASGIEAVRNGVKLPAGTTSSSDLISAGDVSSLMAVLGDGGNGDGDVAFEMWYRCDTAFDFSTTDIFTLWEIGDTESDAYSAASDSFRIMLDMGADTFTVFARGKVGTNFLPFEWELTGQNVAGQPFKDMVPGGIYHIVWTRDGAAALPVVHVNKLGDALPGDSSGDTMASGGFGFTGSVTAWGGGSDLVLRTGHTKREGDPLEKALPGGILFSAVHDVFFSDARVGEHFRAGVANSIAAAKPTIEVHVGENSVSPLTDLVNTDTIDDADGDAISYFVASLPSNGDLMFEGASVSIGDLVNGTKISQFTYEQTADPNQYDDASECAAGGSDSFTFKAWDGVCGGLPGDPNDADCLSQTVTANICVDKESDAPISANVAHIFREGEFEDNEVTISGSDLDDTADFTIQGFRVYSQDFPALGNVTVYDELTGCTKDPVTFPYEVNVTAAPALTTTGEIGKFCYSAADGEGDSGQTIVGVDVVNFRVYDAVGVESAALYTATITIKNALIAGCNPDANFDTTPCEFNVAEDNVGEPDVDVSGLTGYTLRLRGSDALNRTLADRVYKITTLPPASQGFLYQYNTLTPLSAGDDVAAQTSGAYEGEGLITFIPAANYFNRACMGRDYVATDATPCTTVGPTPGATSAIKWRACDFFANPFGACTVSGVTCADDPASMTLDAVFPGCAATFDYQIGITSDGSYSEPKEDGVTLWVYNVNDDSTFDLPAEITKIEKNANPRDKFSDYGNALLTMTDESDTRMVRFSAYVKNSNAKLSNRELPTEVEDRFEWVDNGGAACIENGCTDIRLYGYPSDINVLLADLEFTTTKTSGSDDVVFQITKTPWDAQGNFPAFLVSETDDLNANSTVLLSFGEGEPEENPATAWYIYALAFGGAGVLVLVCAGGCLTGLIQARQGEKFAMMMFRMFLCTDVRHKDPAKRDMDLAEAIKGDVSALESAVHREHRHMVEVMWCVFCLSCICPCCCKYDKNARSNLPTEEAMLEKAVSVEKDRIAARHKPKGAPEASKPTSNEDLETDVIADDSIFDWEVHKDKKTGRTYYYNPKTHESRWTAPEVVVHSKTKKRVVSSRKSKRYKPKPPTEKKDPEDIGDDIV